MDGEPIIPAPRDDDNDDVAWALQTAAVQWNRGAYSDAVIWMQRAVEAAIDAGDASRMNELNNLTASVALRAKTLEQAAADNEDEYEEAEEIDSEELHSDVPGKRASRPPEATPPSIPSDLDHTDEEQADKPVHQEAASTTSEDVAADSPVAHDDSDRPLDEEHDTSESQVGDVDDEAPTIPPPPPAASSSPSSVVLATAASGDADLSLRESVDTLETDPDFERPSSSRPPAHAVPFDGATPQFPEDSRPPEIAFESLAPPATKSIDESLGRGNESEARDSSEEDYTLARQREAAPESPRPEQAAAVRAVPESSDEVAENEGRAIVDGVALDEVRGFQDFPPEVQVALAASANVEALSVDEEVGFFGAALVTRGSVGIMPAIAEVAACVARVGEVVFTRGTLDDGIALRVVALEDDTVVASWDNESLEKALSDCPWVADELRSVADRFQALAGATLGPLGDRLDDSLRTIVTDRLDVRSVAGNEVIVEAGHPVPGLHIIGAGRVEVLEDGNLVDELGPGDFLFAEEVMSHGTAHTTARAGKGGALLLFASRSVAHELLVSVPPLLEILAG